MVESGRAAVPSRGYWQGLESGKLMFQRCDNCGSAVFYPRVLCPSCGGRSLGWEESAGRGTVYATTTLYRRGEEPYDVSLVDLEEGFRMMSRIEGVPPDEVQVGLRVAFAVRAEEQGPVAVFEPEAVSL